MWKPMVGFAEAMFLGYNPKQVELLSLGTCSTSFYMPPKKAKNAGLLRWRSGLLDLIMGAQSQAIDNQLNYFGLRKYIRLTDNLPSDGNFKLDSIEKMEEVQNLARDKFKRTAQEVIQSFFSSKVEPWTPQNYQ